MPYLLREGADAIVQREESAEMGWLIRDIKQNGPSGDQELADVLHPPVTRQWSPPASSHRRDRECCGEVHSGCGGQHPLPGERMSSTPVMWLLIVDSTTDAYWGGD